MKGTDHSEGDQPQIEISCPHCGGASIWNLLQTLNQCAFCGSVLSWPYPEGEPDYLIAESVIKNEQDFIEVLAMYDAMREASRRRGELRGATTGDYDRDIFVDLGAGFTDTTVYEIKKKRIHLFRILKSFCVYVPYQLITSLLAFHVLGRTSVDQKVFRTLFFSSEAILPGYSDEWNFRDRGLQLSRKKLKPLASGKRKDAFLATGEMTREIEKVTRQWTSQRKIFESEIQPICFQGIAVQSHRWWVYRPYYFVNAQAPEGTSWFLLDGQFGTIAGSPTVEEVGKVIRGNWKKLDLHAVRSVHVRLIPFRCPNCGWDVRLRKGIYQFCDNCSRILEVNGERLVVVPYATVPADQLPWWPGNHRGPKVWLPFWRLELSLHFEKQVYEDIAQIISLLVPMAKKTDGELSSLYIPAFDCWTIAKYDQWAFDFGAQLSATLISQQETTLHNVKSSRDFVISPAVSRDLLSTLFPHIAAMYTSRGVQARLNTLIINRLAKAHVLLKKHQLVFVPAALFESHGTDPKLQGPKQPVDWLPLKEGTWPPMLQRTVRRWKAAAQTAAKSAAASQSRKKWLTNRFN